MVSSFDTIDKLQIVVPEVDRQVIKRDEYSIFFLLYTGKQEDGC